MLSYIEYLENLLNGSDSFKPVIYCENQVYSRKQLFNKGYELAAYFASKGLKPNDKIAIHLHNCVEFIFCYFAGIIGGYTIVPVNPALPEKDIEHILSVTNPTFFVKKIEDLTYSPVKIKTKIKSKNSTIASIFFTSGSTNKPKGVCHTLENMLANAIAFNELAGINQDTRMLHVMPMAYMAGFLNTVLCPILAGGCIIIAPQFSAINAMKFWQYALEGNINAMWLSPSMAMLLARLNRDSIIPQWTRNNLTHVFIGTAPLSEYIKNLFEETFGFECLESYGMTEVMLVSCNTPKYPRIKKSVGRLLPGIEIQARDQDGKSLQIDEGNLYIRTPFALKGYLSESGELCSALDDGWLATGDYGYVNKHDDLFVTGRLKDIIIRGGAKISPRAVQEVLIKHPDIVEAIVMGKSHHFWGEEVVAFLQLDKNKDFNKEKIFQFCQENLNLDSIPNIFKVIKTFPRSSTGKIIMHELRELL